jgi:hypothetical protein
MIAQNHCPFCGEPALNECKHLALAAEGRDFVRRCVELSHGEKQWRALGEARRRRRLVTGEWSPEREDYTWLETAFCDEFLKRLTWFGAMEYEWRSGPKPQQAGFWVLLWSKDPRQLWWQLRDEFERQTHQRLPLPLPVGSSKTKARSPKPARGAQRPLLF